MSERAVVKLEDVSLMLNLCRDRIDSLKDYFIKLAKRTLYYDAFWVLSDVSFEVGRGEVFGILGLNGAGKSTLLKLIAGVYQPTRGRVTVDGSVAPLIELGAGFDYEFSVRENVLLNGAALGFSAKQMGAKYDGIVEFAELEGFENVPLKNFSSGMVARLGFAIATAVSPDVLIADEILGVGDFRFQAKCRARIQDMLDCGTTVLLVSHSLEMVRSMCTRALLLEKGRVKAIGPVDTVCQLYEA